MSIEALTRDANEILDRATTENRDLTKDEDARYSELLKMIKHIKSGERHVYLEPDNQRHDSELQDGEVRALLPEQRMADLLPEQKERPSLRKMIRGLVLGDWKDAEVERRAMSEGTGALGGWLLSPAISANIIDMTRNKSVCIAGGAKTIPMETSEMVVVKITSDPTAYWRKESLKITESEAGFAPINLKAQVLGCLVRVTLELLEDAKDFSNTIENAISQALALELDRVGLLGTGVDEPLGIFNMSGVQENSLGTNGAALTSYDEFSESCELVANENGQASAVIMAPRTFYVLDRLKEATTNAPLKAPKSYEDLAKFVTNQIPINQVKGSATNASCAIIGDFHNALAFGIRNQVVLEASRAGGEGVDVFSSMEVLIRGYLRADVAILRAPHFVKMTGIIPA